LYALRKIKEEMDLMSTARICNLLTLRPDQPFHCLRILPSRYTVFRVIGQSNQKLGVFLLLAGLLSGSAAAQGMFKCKDAAGKITYSGRDCHLIGLAPAGEVTGRAVVTPIVKSAPSKPAPPAAEPAKATKPEAASQSAAAAKDPAAPERRCFTVKTAKGTTARCNDKPNEEDPATK